MDQMAKLIAAADKVAKKGLEAGFLTSKQSNDVQETASLAEQQMLIVKQARIAVDSWRTENEAREMRKLGRMLDRCPGGRSK